MKVVPGTKNYNKAHTKKVLIVCDSIAGGIKRPELMKDLSDRGMDVDISIRRYAGGQLHKLHHHAKQKYC